jgi:hypothetical protein
MNLSLSKVFRNKYIMSGMIISIILLCIVLTMAISNADGTAGITYRAHVAYNGWMDWASDGATAGTTGESRRMEAIKIKLTGDMAGDEIVQLYLRDKYSQVTRPVKELKDFARISLQPGESKVVEFTITPDKLMYLDKKMQPIVEAGEFVVMVGSSSDDNDLMCASFWVK